MESSSLHNMLRNIYGCSEIEKNKQIVFTDLQYTTYMQLKLRNNATYVESERIWRKPQKLYVSGLNFTNSLSGALGSL